MLVRASHKDIVRIHHYYYGGLRRYLPASVEVEEDDYCALLKKDEKGQGAIKYRFQQEGHSNSMTQDKFSSVLI
jgi:hypothetical protein